jgi:hypothetical protein
MTKARRPYLYVISALSRKYARLKGRLLGAPGSNQVITDMAHVGAVLRMFDPELDLDVIRPRRVYEPNRRKFSRTALGIMRTAGRPLQARELARMVMEAQGTDPTDHKRLLSISCGLQAVLGRLEGQGLVVTTGKPRRWAIAP